MKFNRKPIVVTMGEPSGISSEIIIKTWIQRNIKKIPPFVLIDDLSKLKKVNDFFRLNAKFHSLKSTEDPSKIFNRSIPVIDLEVNIKVCLGSPDKKNSKHVIESINQAYELIQKKKASAMLTLPVCKRTLKNANFFFPGQTEYLSDLVKKKTGITRSEIMILSTTKPVDKGKNLIVGLVTTHISLKEIIKKINRPIVEKKITAFKRSLSNIWNIKLPRIGITSINPHAGEGGLIGDEEIRLIEPIIKDFRKKGVRIFGPLSSDSCFSKTKRMEFDGILCFYHDQGLIPVKTLDFENSINITGGLPFLRVSPDHGPAFDIANKNVASIESLVASFKFLERMI